PSELLAVDLDFVRLRLLEELGVSLSQSLPFANLLIEAEIAARARPPLIVLGQCEAGFLKDTLHFNERDIVILERVNRHYVRTLRKARRLLWLIAIAILISANPNVAEHVLIADIPLERLDL